MTAFVLRIVFSSAVFVTLVFASDLSAIAHAQSSQTLSLQGQLDAVKKQQMTARKQAALQEAAVKIAKQRVAELEKQLAESRMRIEKAAAGFKRAEATAAEKDKQIAAIAKQLNAHQKADALVADSEDSARLVQEANNRQSELSDKIAKLRQQQTEQQRRHADSTKALAVTKEGAAKKLAELQSLRAKYDAAGLKVDVARSEVEAARKVVKSAKVTADAESMKVADAKAAETEAIQSLKALEDSLATIQAAAKESGADENASLELKKSIDALKMLQEQAAAVVKAATAQQAAASASFDKANERLDASQGKLRKLQNEYAQQSRSHFKLQLAVADLQNLERALPLEIADASKQQTQLAATLKTLSSEAEENAAKAKQLEAAYVARQKLAEAELESLGRFVSFSRQIAPIFAKRCVACHNTRTASGRLNMDSFAALARGGESGDAFAAHNSADSLLMTMVEDGSMPKDADPLAKEEIALIKKWIDVGAPLDAGVVASTELFQVMPETAQPLPPETYRVPIPVTATAFNTDASVLASSGYHEVLLWNTDEGKLIRRITNVAERVYDLEFSQDGSELLVAAGTPGQLGEVKVFSTTDGKHLRTLVRTRDAVFAVALSPDGKIVAAGGADRVVYQVGLASGKELLKIEDHADWVMDVNWSPDGKQLVSASRDKTSKVFDAATGNSLITFNGHGNAVYSAAFLSDGKSVVSAGSDRNARVWTTADANEVRKIGGFGSDIFRVTVTAGDHLLTACADRNAREHDLSDGKVIRTFAGHKDWVYTLCFNAAKQVIATGSYDGEIRIWNSKDGSVATSFIAIPQAPKNTTVAGSATPDAASAE